MTRSMMGGLRGATLMTAAGSMMTMTAADLSYSTASADIAALGLGTAIAASAATG